MSKYQNGKIYKIVDVGYNKCYIGSTCEKLSKRMARHRQKYHTYLKEPVDFFSSFKLFEEFGVESCKIELIENYPCKSREELLRREGHYIKQSECVNKVVSGRTNKEYKLDNIEKIREQKREAYYKDKEEGNSYYQRNKERILEKKRVKTNCPVCKCDISIGCLRRHNNSNRHLNNLQEPKNE